MVNLRPRPKVSGQMHLSIISWGASSCYSSTSFYSLDLKRGEWSRRGSTILAQHSLLPWLLLLCSSFPCWNYGLERGGLSAERDGCLPPTSYPDCSTSVGFAYHLNINQSGHQTSFPKEGTPQSVTVEYAPLSGTTSLISDGSNTRRISNKYILVALTSSLLCDKAPLPDVSLLHMY